MEYSSNGYEVSLYLLALTSAIACLTAVALGRRKLAAAGSGAAFAACCAILPETVLAFGLASLACLARPSRPATDHRALSGQSRRDLVRALLTAWLAFGLALALYAGACLVVTGRTGLHLAGFDLAAAHSRRVDPREAARDQYGRPVVAAPSGETAETLPSWAARVSRSVSQNLFYNLERLPGILLTPAPLFALLLLLLRGRRKVASPENLPLLVMLVFPLAVYVLFEIEPRRLIPILVPLQVLGAAGLLALADYLRRDSRLPGLLPALAVAVLALSAGLSAWRGLDLERQQQLHRDLAVWLARHVDRTAAIAGCGYGFVSTTGFLSGNPTAPRVWTDDPVEIQRFVDRQGLQWLILYESFLRKANPELLPVLDGQLPGFQRVFEARDHAGLRAQVFHRLPPQSR